MTVFVTIREYFLLSDARAAATGVSEDARAAISRQLDVGRQRSEAAEALWSLGHVAEGLRLAAEAFDATVAGVAPFERAVGPGSGRAALVGEEPAVREPERDEQDQPTSSAGDLEGSELGGASAPSEESDAETEGKSDEASSASEAVDEGAQTRADTAQLEAARPKDDARVAAPSEREIGSHAGEPAWASSLRARGLSERKVRAVLEAHQAAHKKPLPLLDDEVSASEGETFQQLVTARRHVNELLSPASMTPGQLAWTRASRIGLAAFLASAMIIGLYLLLRPAIGVEATASAQFNTEFLPGNVVDGDDASEWLLPDRQQGWVDVRIMPPEHISTLRLKNSHNRHYNDRATHEYTIEVFSNGRSVRTVQGSWERISPRPDWTEHALDIDDVESIRINVRSWHRSGGGLAEIDWD